MSQVRLFHLPIEVPSLMHLLCQKSKLQHYISQAQINAYVLVTNLGYCICHVSWLGYGIVYVTQVYMMASAYTIRPGYGFCLCHELVHGIFLYHKWRL